MVRTLIILGSCALVASACVGGGSPAAPTPEGAPTDGPTGESITAALIYWDSFDFFGNEIPPEKQRIFDEMTIRKDERYIPYLLDLMAVPSPFRGHAFEVLTAWLGPTGGFGPLEWWEQRGFRDPAADTPEYLAFKRQIFRTIQPELGDFLDPDAPKTISAQEVMWGGVTVDGIPPLTDPRFVTPAEAAAWILPTDQVIGVEINGDARAYPRRIIDWHEMVNDTVGGVPVSLAYCTLCGSAILYDGRVGDATYRFGTSGLLYRSNKLMYDYQTRTLWKQYTGEPAWGHLVGRAIRLKTIPVVQTTYAEWLAAHPSTRVLDIETGYQRDYGPGVAYADYWANPDLMFPAPNRGGPLEVKDDVYAVRLDGELTAYPIDLLRERVLIHDRIAGREVVVLATADGSGARAYESNGVTLTSFDLSTGIAQSGDGREWRLTETALVSTGGDELARVPGHNSFWFAVINHTPNGRLYEE
jgi:hypothetical protein